MKAVVLLSGGIDSTTCLAHAIRIFGKANVSALFVTYGQKHIREYESAKAVAEYYDISLFENDLSAVYRWSKCSLLKHSGAEIPHEAYDEQLKHSEVVSTYVPFRNGLLLSTAAAMAMTIYPNEQVALYYGAHADDAAGNAYPDCSVAFTHAMDEALQQGTAQMCSLFAPLVKLTKAEVVAAGTRLYAPYALTWSCYEGGDKHCGVCGTCRDRKKAFKLNGISDPTEYKE